MRVPAATSIAMMRISRRRDIRPARNGRDGRCAPVTDRADPRPMTTAKDFRLPSRAWDDLPAAKGERPPAVRATVGRATAGPTMRMAAPVDSARTDRSAAFPTD